MALLECSYVGERGAAVLFSYSLEGIGKRGREAVSADSVNAMQPYNIQ